jgi:hypothetical protein
MSDFLNQFVSSDERVIERYASAAIDKIKNALDTASRKGEWLIINEISDRAGVSLATTRARIYQVPMLRSRKCLRRGCNREYQIRRK